MVTSSPVSGTRGYGPFGGAFADPADLSCAVSSPAAGSSAAAEFEMEGPDRLADRRGTLGRTAEAESFATRLVAGGVVTVSLPSGVASARALDRAARELSPVTDAIVIGEAHGSASSSPSHRAWLLRAGGSGVIVALSCRERNRVALEGELAALADIGVDAILALTGGLPEGAAPARAAHSAVLDLDAARLARLARRAGHLVGAAGSSLPRSDLRMIDHDDPSLGSRASHEAPLIAVVPVEVSAPDGIEVAARRAGAAMVSGAAGVHLWVADDYPDGPNGSIEVLAETASRIRSAVL